MKKLLLLLVILSPFTFHLSPLSAQDFDFSARIGGNTLYFYITDLHKNTVEVAFPGPSEEEPWKGVRKPHGQLTIPETVMHDSVEYKVTAIRYYAFKGCDRITLLVIPSGLKEIGEGAFEGCRSIRNIFSSAIVPPHLDESSFNGVKLDISVRVPTGTYSNYQNAVGWRQFTEIVEF